MEKILEAICKELQYQNKLLKERNKLLEKQLYLERYKAYPIYQVSADRREIEIRNIKESVKHFRESQDEPAE